jgi:hypothetical protein
LPAVSVAAAVFSWRHFGAASAARGLASRTGLITSAAGQQIAWLAPEAEDPCAVLNHGFRFFSAALGRDSVLR